MAQLAREGFDPAFGARPLKRVIQREIGDKASMLILGGEVADGGTIVVRAGGPDDGLLIRQATPGVIDHGGSDPWRERDRVSRKWRAGGCDEFEATAVGLGEATGERQPRPCAARWSLGRSNSVGRDRREPPGRRPRS